jgi:hypothetical protein
MKVIEDACFTYACACTVKTATKPSQPIEKHSGSQSAGAGNRGQVRGSPSVTPAGENVCAAWCGTAGSDLVRMDRAMRATAGAVISAAEAVCTGFQSGGNRPHASEGVLDRKLPQARKGRIWPYVGDRDHVAAVYDYTATRERAGPEEFLKSYRGHLQADAYAAYDAFFTQPERGMVEVGCWAHARRHFHEALDTDPSRMRTVLLLIAQLYAVERTARERGFEGEPLRLLREHGSPVLEQLYAYLLEIRNQVPPKSDAGQAVAYTLKKLDRVDALLPESGFVHR